MVTMQSPFRPGSGTTTLNFDSTWRISYYPTMTAWQSYCPLCNRTWVRRNERSGKRSFRRHMELVHGAQSDEQVEL